MDPLVGASVDPRLKALVKSLFPAHFLIFHSSLKFMTPQISVEWWLCTGQTMFCNLALTPLAQSPHSHQSHKSPLKFKGHFSICIITPSLCAPREPNHFLLGTFSFLGFCSMLLYGCNTMVLNPHTGNFPFFFFLNKILPLLLLFWLHWVFVTALELFIVVRGLLYLSRAWLSCPWYVRS